MSIGTELVVFRIAEGDDLSLERTNRTIAAEAAIMLRVATRSRIDLLVDQLREEGVGSRAGMFFPKAVPLRGMVRDDVPLRCSARPRRVSSPRGSREG